MPGVLVSPARSPPYCRTLGSSTHVDDARRALILDARRALILDDLRVTDTPPPTDAVEAAAEVSPVYVFDPRRRGGGGRVRALTPRPGDASGRRWRAPTGRLTRTRR